MLNRSAPLAGAAALALAVTAGTSALLSPAGASTVGAATAGASTDAVRPLPCRAFMSNSHPADFTTTIVEVRTASFARVVTVAHFKTTNHKKTRKAGQHGRVGVPYDISDATPGFRVKVSVTVSKAGRTGHCSTSFTPHR
ncbi:MAG TPA: hypothetical protein VGI64_15760 [Streptosporangiaceae bacterium]